MMVKQNRFLQRAAEVKRMLKNRIRDFEEDHGSSHRVKQLLKITKEIIQMENALSPGDYVPGYPRMIVDSWDFSSELGEELLGLYQDYKELT